MMAWWQQLVAICVGLTAVLTLLGVLGRWIRRMWGIARKLNRLLDQMLGDRSVSPPLPSLMDQLADVRVEQSRLASALAEHVRWHGDPGGRPAAYVYDGPTQRTYQSSNGVPQQSEPAVDITRARHRRRTT